MRLSKAALLAAFCLFISIISCENPWMADILDPLVKEREKGFGDGWGEGGQPVLYSIILNTEELDAADSVSIDKDEAFTGETVTISYTLESIGINNELLLYFGAGATPHVTITAIGTSSYIYTVRAGDAQGGVITIRAVSRHTNLQFLDPPQNVSFTTGGIITFTPGANNAAAAATYIYTLYNDSVPETGFTDQPVTSGTAPAGIVDKMLENSGVYTVRVWAQTTNALYEPLSNQSDPSAAINVYSVGITITGGNNTDKVTVNGEEYTSTFVKNFFAGANITFTAVPDANRYVTWTSGGLESSSNTYVITGINDNIAATAAFADPSITITTQPAATTSVTAESISGSLSVTASVTPAGRTITYQWYSNTSNNNTGGTLISGAASASYTIPATLTAGTYYYYCVVGTAGATDVNSSVAEVVVAEAPFDLAAEVAKFATATANMEIIVPEDVTLTANITIPANGTRTLTIKGDVLTRKITRGYSEGTAANGLFVVSSGANLILEDIIIDGDKDNPAFSGNTAPLIRVNGSSNLTMNNGAILQNNRASAGGGIYISGTVIMNGGKITGNTATGNGGGVTNNSGIFRIYGGEIRGNTAIGNGGGVYVSGTFMVGKTGVVKENYKIDASGISLSNNNVYLTSGCFISLGTGDNVPTGMEIWVQTLAANNGVIVQSGGTEANKAYFHADDTTKEVALVGSTLVIRNKSVEQTFNITIPDFDTNEVIVLPLKLSRANKDGNSSTGELQVTNTYPTGTVITWLFGIDNIELLDDDGNDSILQLDVSDLVNLEPYNVLGYQYVYVEAVLPDNGGTFGVTVRFEVAP
jgi:hypothetical protein